MVVNFSSQKIGITPHKPTRVLIIPGATKSFVKTASKYKASCPILKYSDSLTTGNF